MSMHERSLPWLVCFQCLLPWPSTLLDPSAFLMTNMVNLGEEEMKAFHPLPKLPRHTPREVGTNTLLCSSEYWFKTKKGTSKHLFSPLGPQSGTRGCSIWRTCDPHLCMLKGLPAMLTIEGCLSFPSAVPGPVPTWLCERLSGSTRCGKPLRLQVFLPVIWEHSKAAENWVSALILSLRCSPTPPPPRPPINRATEFRATYSRPSPAIFSQAPHSCSVGLGQVNSSIPDTKFVLFQKRVLDHCFRGFIWCNYSGI